MTEAQANALRSKITILLDENLEGLKSGLRDAGFKVITIEKGLSDEKIIELAEGLAILTDNSQHFLGNAVAGDYDVISMESVKFIDTKPDRTNDTVQKVVKAIRESGLYLLKGNHQLKIHNDGTWSLKQLVI
jgi:hypothetical protein